MAEIEIGVPDGITREDVEEAVKDYSEGIEHGFGPSTKYDVVIDGERYPPKAIIGLAARRISGRILSNQEFSGGKRDKCFEVLEGLGYEIVTKEDDLAEPVGKNGDDGALSVLRDLVPDEGLLEKVARVFAESIEAAHEINEAVWVLTHEKREPYINLNVGKVFALNLRHGSFSALFDADMLEGTGADQESWKAPENEEDEFKSLSNATWREGPLNEFVAAWDQLRDAHLSAVRRAANQVKRTPFFKHHQAGLVRSLGEIVGRPLLQPNYGDQPRRLWVVRAGKDSQAHDQYINRSLVGVGWNKLGDLTGVTTLDEIRDRMREEYPGEPDGYYGTCSAEVLHVVHRMAVGDYAMYAVRDSDDVILGRIVSEFVHSPEEVFAITRRVRWLQLLSREHLPGRVQKSLRATMGCFEVSEPEEEFWEMVEEAELYASLAESFVALRERDDEDGEEVRRHSDEHRLRHDNWLKILDSDTADRNALLAALKDMDWFLGAKKINAPGVVETQEKADDFLARLKDIFANAPTTPGELREAISSLPEGFGLGFVSEFLVYVTPGRHWELNRPVREAIKLIGFEGLEELPRGKRNDYERYFAMRPLVDGLLPALELAGLENPSYLDVDLLLWELARKPANFPGLPVRIDDAALGALLEDLRANYPAFERFDQRDSKWWREERVYKDQLACLFTNELPEEILTADDTESWAREIFDGVRNVLLKPLPSEGKPQNLLSWRHSQYLRPLRDQPNEPPFLRRRQLRRSPRRGADLVDLLANFVTPVSPTHHGTRLAANPTRHLVQ